MERQSTAKDRQELERAAAAPCASIKEDERLGARNCDKLANKICEKCHLVQVCHFVLLDLVLGASLYRFQLQT